MEPLNYFVVSAHREENVDDPSNLSRIISILNQMAETFGLRIIVSTHPRTRKRIDAQKMAFNDLIEFCRPFGFFDYVHLQQNAKAVLSDSGTITEESSILNFPALNIRNAHERPEGMEEGAVMLTGMNPERVFQALEILSSQPRGQRRGLNLVNDYNVSNVSEKVVRIIISYTDYIQRTVWRRDI